MNDLMRQVERVRSGGFLEPSEVARSLYDLAISENKNQFSGAITTILSHIKLRESVSYAKYKYPRETTDRIIASMLQIAPHSDDVNTIAVLEKFKMTSLTATGLAVEECLCPCRQPDVVWKPVSPTFLARLHRGCSFWWRDCSRHIAIRCINCIGDPSDPVVVEFMTSMQRAVTTLPERLDGRILPEHFGRFVHLVDEKHVPMLLKQIPMNQGIAERLVETGICFRQFYSRLYCLWNRPKTSPQKADTQCDAYSFEFEIFGTCDDEQDLDVMRMNGEVCDLEISDVATQLMCHPNINPRDRQVILESAPTLPALLRALFSLERRGINIFENNFYYLVDYICNKRLYSTKDADLYRSVNGKIIEMLNSLELSLRNTKIPRATRTKICRTISDTFRGVDNDVYRDHPVFSLVADTMNMDCLVPGSTYSASSLGCFVPGDDSRTSLSVYSCAESLETYASNARSGFVYPLNHSKTCAITDVMERPFSNMDNVGTLLAMKFASIVLGGKYKLRSGIVVVGDNYASGKITSLELQALCDIPLDSHEMCYDLCPFGTNIPQYVREAFKNFKGFVRDAIIIIALRRKSSSLLNTVVNETFKVDLSDIHPDVVPSFDRDIWNFVLENRRCFVTGTLDFMISKHRR